MTGASVEWVPDPDPPGFSGVGGKFAVAAVDTDVEDSRITIATPGTTFNRTVAILPTAY